MVYSIAPRWLIVGSFAVVGFCVLGFYELSAAAPPRETNEPFANAVEQRNQMIEQLKQTNALLKEQNALLRSGDLQVVIKDPKKRAP